MTVGAARYAIDARGSRFTLYAYAGGMLSMVGHDPVIVARELTGDVRFSPEDPGAAGVLLKIPAGPLAVQNDISDKDRREIEQTMREEVLEVEKYPEIVYEASKPLVETLNESRYRVQLDGELSLHGVARRERVSLQMFVVGDTLRVQGDAVVRQSDYGIAPPSVAGGALKIKDEVKCVFDLLARKVS